MRWHEGQTSRTPAQIGDGQDFTILLMLLMALVVQSAHAAASSIFMPVTVIKRRRLNPRLRPRRPSGYRERGGFGAPHRYGRPPRSQSTGIPKQMGVEPELLPSDAR